MVPMMLHLEPTSSDIMHTEKVGEREKWGRKGEREVGENWNVEWRDLKSLLNFA